MSDKTGNDDWDDFKAESEALEKEMDELDQKINEIEDQIKEKTHE